MLKLLSLIIVLFFIAINSDLKAAEAGMPQLNPEYWLAQIFWLIFIFGSVYLIIWKLILPKITGSIEGRKKHLVNDLDEAQKIKLNAEKKLKEYELIVQRAKKDAKKIISEGKRKLEEEINEKRGNFDKEIENELASAENQIKKFKISSIDNINKIAISISDEIIKNTLGSEANKSNITAIVGEISKTKTEKNL